MNFSVYNTESLNNFPDSGIYSTYYSHLDGITPSNTNAYSITTDDQYIYYPSLQYTYISKNIQTIAVLNTNGDIISQIKPTISTGATIIYIDNDYVYFVAQGLTYKSNANDQNRNLYRFNKNTHKIDQNFCLGGWNGYNPILIKNYDNKYYLFSNSNSLANEIYPNLDDKSDAGIFIIKNDKNISNLKIVTANFSKIKIKDENVYICGTTAHSRATKIYSKIFRINKNGQIDKNFYPYIERSNSTNPGILGSFSSSVYDFDFDNEGIYIGGNFLTVNGDVRTGLAKIDYSGNIISGFNTDLRQSTNSIDIVRAVATSGSGVFIGGFLNYSGDTTKSRLLKLNNDGTLNAEFTGYQAISTNTVFNLLLSGNSLYAGGNFSSPGGIYGAGVIKFNANNGSVDPNFNVEFANATTTDMKISGNNLYVSTSTPNVWSNYNGGLVTRTGVFKVNASNGEPDANFQINFNTSAGSLYSVTNMLIKGNELHIVGTFTGINNYRLNGYAVVDTTNGALLNTVDKFSYGLNSALGHRAINYNPNNDTIIIAGNSTFPFGTGYNSNYNSKINVFDNNFNILTGIQFVASGMNNTNSMFAAISAANTNATLFNNNTGYIPIADPNNVLNSRVNIYNLDNGNIINDNSLFYLSGNNIFNSIVKYNNDLYFGGGFSQVYSNGFTGTRVGVVKTNINGVIDSSFNLNLTGSSNSIVSNLKIIDNNLFIIGNSVLTGASGIRVNNFVKYNLLTNSIDTGFNNFLTTGQTYIKDVHNDSQNNLYFVMNYNNLIEYTGIGGYNDNSGHLFKFSSGSYTPDLNFANKYFWLTENISINNDKIYAPLRNTQKISGSNIYKINKKTREILPHKVFLNGNFIYDIYSNNNSIYFCGSFTGINNIPQTGFGKLNKSDLSVDSNFSLNPTSSVSILKILEKDNHLYFAGGFSGVIQSGITTLTSGLCRISKTNDEVDTSFQINQSGLSLPATLDASISGNYVYILNSSVPLLRIIDINAKQLQFTGTATAISTATMYGITTTPNNLFISAGPTTKTDSRLVGSRGKNVFMAGFNSGEIIPPYSSWNSQNNSIFLAARYVPMNNTVAISPSTASVNINNTSNSSTASLVFFDADKMYIKNTRNTVYSVSLPSNYTTPRLYSPNNYETYILYNNYLLANPEDNITWIYNNALTRGIIKYNAIKERYDIII